MGTGGEKRKELGAKEGGRAEQGSPGGLGLAQEEVWEEGRGSLGAGGTTEPQLPRQRT